MNIQGFPEGFRVISAVVLLVMLIGFRRSLDQVSSNGGHDMRTIETKDLAILNLVLATRPDLARALGEAAQALASGLLPEPEKAPEALKAEPAPASGPGLVQAHPSPEEWAGRISGWLRANPGRRTLSEIRAGLRAPAEGEPGAKAFKNGLHASILKGEVAGPGSAERGPHIGPRKPRAKKPLDGLGPAE